MPEITDTLLAQSFPPTTIAREESALDVVKAKARELTQKTGGILVGDFSTSSNDDATIINFSMSMPAMDDAFQDLFQAIYPNDRDYPVWIHAPEFPGSLKLPPYHILTPEQEKEDFVAHSPEEFRRLIDKVLTSDENLGLLDSYTQECKKLLSEPEADEQP